MYVLRKRRKSFGKKSHSAQKSQSLKQQCSQMGDPWYACEFLVRFVGL